MLTLINGVSPAVYLILFTTLTGPAENGAGNGVTIQRTDSLKQCEALGEAARVWLQGRYVDHVEFQCVELPPR